MLVYVLLSLSLSLSLPNCILSCIEVSLLTRLHHSLSLSRLSCWILKKSGVSGVGVGEGVGRRGRERERVCVCERGGGEMGGGDLHVKPNKFLEQWAARREAVEHGWRFTPKNVMVAITVGLVVPAAVYAGICGEFVRTKYTHTHTHTHIQREREK